jgi:hypothetical protein
VVFGLPLVVALAEANTFTSDQINSRNYMHGCMAKGRFCNLNFLGES